MIFVKKYLPLKHQPAIQNPPEPINISSCLEESYSSNITILHNLKCNIRITIYKGGSKRIACRSLCLDSSSATNPKNLLHLLPFGAWFNAAFRGIYFLMKGPVKIRTIDNKIALHV